MKKIFLFNLIIILSLFTGYAQDENNPITTAASFLLIAPDARSGSMGDIGVPRAHSGKGLCQSNDEIPVIDKAIGKFVEKFFAIL